MSSDESGASEMDDVSEWTQEWLETRAAEHGVQADELLQRIAWVFRATRDGELAEVQPRDTLAELEAEVDTLEAVLDDLREDVDALDAELDRKIQDVRERVIQVKRETDAKAPADHDHPDLEGEIDAATDAATSARSDVDAFEAAVDDLERRLDEGFDNFEDILEFLTTEVDDVGEKNTRLAQAIVSMRESIRGMAQREGRRIAADRLREQANEYGIRTADCDDCGATLDVALLTDARCPHCANTFASVEPKRGFFGSPTLEVGDRPAIEAGDAPRPGAVDLDDVISDAAGPSTGPDHRSPTAEGHTDGGETRDDAAPDTGDRA